ncbi:MAG: phosphatase PAP2 family protein [Alphaproteobacteria bacterium]|nr:phosphatase PAP2 family protein [Alphaproteobacteria bacterium]HPF47893.1 phosphatase PAP2 family protein [Emcibacteraceae bacterium]HRW29437.1 phosphatase PAP2 family protein [Emcibacteraceae bacterium]
MEISEEIWIENERFPFDIELSRWMAQIQTPISQQFLGLLTKLGGMEWMGGLGVLCIAILIMKKQLTESIVLAVGFAVTMTSVLVIKFLSDRVRPVSVFSLEQSTSAFPSGHMAVSLFLYGFIAYLISRKIKDTRFSLGVIIIGIVFAVMIGISRLYLNVHWLSDVLGGFALGASYLCLCIGFLELTSKYKNQ